MAVAKARRHFREECRTGGDPSRAAACFLVCGAWLLGQLCAGCSNGATGGSRDAAPTQQVPADPCAGVTCSGHGTCVSLGAEVRCECESGYVPLGLECVVAQVYWVSPEGAAGWAQCKSDAPLAGAAACSLATANASAAAGDTVILRGGTYAGSTIAPGNSGASVAAPIVFAGYAPEVVRFSASSCGIKLVNKSYVTVRGVGFFDMRLFFTIEGGHGNEIGHCDFDGRSADSGSWQGARIYAYSPTGEGSTHNWIHHCTFQRWAYGAYDEHRGGLLDLGRALEEGDDSWHNLIEHNAFAYGGHHTLGVYSKYNVIRGNYIHNETNAANWDFEGYRGAITEGPSGGWCLYEGNRFAYSGGSGLALRTPHNIVRFNMFYRHASGGIQVVASEAGADHADHNRIFHNTFYRNGHESDYSGFACGLYFSNWGDVDPVGNVVKNNIFFDNSNGSVCYDGTFPRPEVVGNWEDNSRDPGFVDLSGTDPNTSALPDFHLVAGSVAADAGAPLTTIAGGGGTSNAFVVADAGYFTNGWEMAPGDLVQLAGQTETARILDVDYGTNTITVDRTLTFAAGQGVSLAYVGAAPDLGAFEIGAGQ